MRMKRNFICTWPLGAMVLGRWCGGVGGGGRVVLGMEAPPRPGNPGQGRPRLQGKVTINPLNIVYVYIYIYIYIHICLNS